MLKEKTQIFNVNSIFVTHGSIISSDTYQVGDCWATSTGDPSDGTARQVEQVDLEDVVISQSGPLIRATNNRPIFYVHHDQVYFQPQSIPNWTYRLNTIRRPKLPNWTYLLGNNQNALFNPDISAGWQDFELHKSEESKLVIKILQLAGVSMKDYNLTQLAAQKETSVIQQEKQ